MIMTIILLVWYKLINEKEYTAINHTEHITKFSSQRSNHSTLNNIYH